MTRDEQTERGRSERTRTTRFFEAMQLARPIVDDMLRGIECVLRNEQTNEGLKAAALDAYGKACEILADVGLEVRHRGLKYAAMNVPDPAVRIDVEFALAAPLDGRDAPPGVGGPFVHRARRGGVGAVPLRHRPPVLALRDTDAANRGRRRVPA